MQHTFNEKKSFAMALLYRIYKDTDIYILQIKYFTK